MSGDLGVNETLGWVCGACSAVNQISRATCFRCMTSVTYSSGMGDMTAKSMSGTGAKRTMIAVDKTKTMDPMALEATKNDIEKFCQLMERGLEVDMSATNSIRVLFMDRERTGLFIAPEDAEVFKADQAVYFGNVLRFVAVTECTHASRIAVIHKERGREVKLELDVDTNKSRDILVDMLSKVVAVYTKNKRGQEEVTIAGALSSVISSFSSSLWGLGPNTDTDKPLRRQKSSTRKALLRKLSSSRGSFKRQTSSSSGGAKQQGAAFRKMMSNEGRELFRNSMDGLESPRRTSPRHT